MTDPEQELYKVCPECAGEYRPEIERCADCDVPLVPPEEIALRDARELRVTSGLVALRTAPIAWVRTLVEDLAGQGIPYGVDRREARREGLLTLYVRRQDGAAAKAVDAARRRIEAPFEPQEEEASEEPANVVPIREEEPTCKVCPRCGGEYRLDAERCADCGGELVFPGEAPEEAAEDRPPAESDEDGLPFPAPLHELSPDDDLVCVYCTREPFIRRLSRRLDAAGIAHRFDPAPYPEHVGVWCLYVLPEGREAMEALRNDTGTSIEEVDPAELTVCPACGTPHPLGALECSHCSLVLGFEDTAVDEPDRGCRRCGAILAFESAVCCPNCGEFLVYPEDGT